MEVFGDRDNCIAMKPTHKLRLQFVKLFTRQLSHTFFYSSTRFLYTANSQHVIKSVLIFACQMLKGLLINLANWNFPFGKTKEFKIRSW